MPVRTACAAHDERRGHTRTTDMVDGWGRDHHRMMKQYPYLACFEVAIRDDNTGQIRVGRHGTGDPMPGRITVLTSDGALQTVGAESNDTMAVRPGVIYCNGKASFGIPAGDYIVYIGRGCPESGPSWQLDAEDPYLDDPDDKVAVIDRGVCTFDSKYQRAIDAGGKELRPVKDQFYGDRSGTLEDPFGHQWTIATHKEEVSPEELKRRSQAFFEQMAQQKA